MEIYQNMINDLDASYIDDNRINFEGDNKSKVIYNSELNKWDYYGNYFKIINPRRISVPKKITIFSNIQETIFFYNEWTQGPERESFDEQLMICSNKDTVDELLRYIYDCILIFNKNSLNIDVYHRSDCCSGIVSMININNFFTSNKIICRQIENSLLFSNDHLLDMTVDVNNMEQILKPYIQYNLTNKLLKKQNYDYLLSW
ncbi:hypothetical protein D1632_00310 [Chryseobacterium nematophagum]|uniref:Uncharacterized protein n=1 Tax=Chryseobacterium nematophagum TaxID=2305228 RepID=A0A3M7LGH8_9FLAO|nr:hypothetical protein [Chryseobacterium nematophagum]RMZ61289.1 hypothetical protein D1632_00310 [Chryseobacterium nematophagum]